MDGPTVQDEIDQVVTIAAETIGELMEFWGFRRSMGLVWTVLYLSDAPLSQEAIARFSGLSTGAVSMTLNELSTWGVVHREVVAGTRKRHYRAETDISKMILKVLRDREIKKLATSIQRLERATLRLMAMERTLRPSTERARLVHTLQRVQDLTRVVKSGRKVLEGIAALRGPNLAPLGDFLRGR